VSAHTPGPWIAKRHAGYVETDWRIKPAHPIKGSTVGFAPHAVVKGDARIVSEAEKAANASLIAAAPELLEALQRIASFTAYQDCDNCLEMNAVARAAIAKATGDTP